MLLSQLQHSRIPLKEGVRGGAMLVQCWCNAVMIINLMLLNRAVLQVAEGVSACALPAHPHNNTHHCQQHHRHLAHYSVASNPTPLASSPLNPSCPTHTQLCCHQRGRGVGYGAAGSRGCLSLCHRRGTSRGTQPAPALPHHTYPFRNTLPFRTRTQLPPTPPPPHPSVPLAQLVTASPHPTKTRTTVKSDNNSTV